MIRFFVRAASAAALLAALAAPAFAHITLDTPSAAAGSSYKAVLRVPHGCDSAATTAIRLKVPEGFVSAKPMPKPGWTLDIKTGPYAKSYPLFGSKVTEGATEITWSGGNLPDNEYDEFAVRGTLASDLPAGSTLFFPVIQVCGSAQEDWIDTSGGESETPAPGLEVTAPAGAGD
jgi:uncharacterized protein YcnI